MTNQKTNWKYILIILILAILVGGGILGYLGYFKREIVSLSKFPEIKKQEKIVEDETVDWKIYTDEEIRKIGDEIFCDWSRNPDNCYDFLNSLFNNPVDSHIVGNDEKLKEYLENNLEQLRFYGISRGKFDKYSEEEAVVASLTLRAAKYFISYVILFQEKIKEKWQTSYQNIGAYHFFNEPRELIKDEPAFFVGKSTAFGGTCVPVRWSSVVFRLENNTFKSIWSSIYFIDGEIYDEKGYPINQVEKMETDIEYRDLDGDGNFEIIKRGIRKLCKGRCFDCEEVLKEEKVYQVFKWDAQKQTFVEKPVE